ncbi:conserved hypothetical protein [Candidatus Desulfarcum epimagneticum]|uniref:Uncharacterized protein n=1 Tax=uncultured Desulfobacteraceae bacterium TaxID=218296 RepID=A0A484HMV1_9BACT|nr:conserved hypothetical protein [uncultured Desulfobacteraceae bacterium]
MGSFIKSFLGETAGIAVSSGIFLVKKILNKKGIHTNIQYLIGSVLDHNNENKSLPEEVIRQAKAIEKIFKDRHVFPDRIAIDGLPGSGKSSLAAALAKRMDMEVVCLDHQDMEERFSFEKAPAIYEHHRLLRTQDMDRFDVMIYIDQPVEKAKQNILKRQRGAYLVDIMNFELMKKIGKKAFSLADGQVISVDHSFVRIKIRPDNGYRDMANLDSELSAKAAGDSAGEVLNKEQRIFLLTEGRARKGFLSYVNPRAYERELLSALIVGVDSASKKKKLRG